LGVPVTGEFELKNDDGWRDLDYLLQHHVDWSENNAKTKLLSVYDAQGFFKTSKKERKQLLDGLHSRHESLIATAKKIDSTKFLYIRLRKIVDNFTSHTTGNLDLNVNKLAKEEYSLNYDLRDFFNKKLPKAGNTDGLTFLLTSGWKGFQDRADGISMGLETTLAFMIEAMEDNGFLPRTGKPYKKEDYNPELLLLYEKYQELKTTGKVEDLGMAEAGAGGALEVLGGGDSVDDAVGDGSGAREPGPDTPRASEFHAVQGEGLEQLFSQYDFSILKEVMTADAQRGNAKMYLWRNKGSLEQMVPGVRNAYRIGAKFKQAFLFARQYVENPDIDRDFNIVMQEEFVLAGEVKSIIDNFANHVKDEPNAKNLVETLLPQLYKKANNIMEKFKVLAQEMETLMAQVNLTVPENFRVASGDGIVPPADGSDTSGDDLLGENKKAKGGFKWFKRIAIPLGLLASAFMIDKGISTDKEPAEPEGTHLTSTDSDENSQDIIEREKRADEYRNAGLSSDGEPTKTEVRKYSDSDKIKIKGFENLKVVKIESGHFEEDGLPDGQKNYVEFVDGAYFNGSMEHGQFVFGTFRDSGPEGKSREYFGGFKDGFFHGKAKIINEETKEIEYTSFDHGVRMKDYEDEKEQKRDKNPELSKYQTREYSDSDEIKIKRFENWKVTKITGTFDKDGLPHGRPTRVDFEGGGQFYGEMDHGQIVGGGELWYPTNSEGKTIRYLGGFTDGLPHGKATIIYEETHTSELSHYTHGVRDKVYKSEAEQDADDTDYDNEKKEDGVFRAVKTYKESVPVFKGLPKHFPKEISGSFDKENLPHGQIKIIFENGDSFDGMAEHGNLKNGEWKWADDTVYNGPFNKNNKPHGEGKLTLPPNGIVKDVVFDNGIVIKIGGVEKKPVKEKKPKPGKKWTR